MKQLSISEFLINNFIKTFLIQGLVIIFILVYIHFNPLAADITFEEFNILGFDFIDQSMYNKVQQGNSLAELLPLITELQNSFDMSKLPALMNDMPYKVINILLKRLMYFFLFVDLPTHLCLYIYLTTFFAYLFHIKKMQDKVRWKDFFKLYVTLLSTVLIVALVILVPSYFRYLSFQNYLISKTETVSQVMMNGNYLSLFGELGTFMKHFNGLKGSIESALNVIVLFIGCMIFFCLFMFYQIQKEGFSKGALITSVMISIKNYKKTLVATLILLFLLWLIVTSGHEFLTILYTFLTIQIFSGIMYMGTDIARTLHERLRALSAPG